MGEIQYLNESLWIYHWGHFLLFLSFIGALFATYSYYRESKALKFNQDESGWKRLGRIGFLIHSVSILSVIGMIFFAMFNEMYEYYYVFQHVNSQLPKEYIFSAFWEGQEGSFMLWLFWHVILAVVLIVRAGKWEAPVMAVILLAQSVILVMLLGIHIEWGNLEVKIGSNPLVLLRDVFDAPVFYNADYLSTIEGQGLNPLLQNYWNVIHPPVLFLGFSALIIPYAYAVGMMYTGWRQDWIKDSFKWSLFAVAIFGIGILMGGAWAYEALSFGGYWAWDPVENSSFVPWLTLVAGVHTHMIARNTGYSVRATLIFYLISFILVLYSTFLTRSGILGDTSVHAFTEMGLESQLLMLIAIFFLLGIGLLIKSWKSFRDHEKEESIYSREFWMFIGSLVLLFSAVLIIGATSLPVYNQIVQLFNPEYKGIVIKDPVDHYNKYQIWIAIFISFLSGCTVFVRYGSLPLSFAKWRKMGLILGVALAGSLIMVLLLERWISLYTWQYRLLAFSAFFVLLTNGYYLVNSLRMNIKLGGAGFSHFGFGLMIIGVLTSGLNKSHITTSFLNRDQLAGNEELANLTMFLQGFPVFLNGYWIEYKGDSVTERSRYFEMEFKRFNKDQQLAESFTLYPSVLMSNDKTQVVAQIPATRHYLTKDIFTHIAGLPPSKRDVEEAKALEDSLIYKTFVVTQGDSIVTDNYTVVLKSYTFQPNHPHFEKDRSDFAIQLNMEVFDRDIDTVYTVHPVLFMDNTLIMTIAELVNPLEIKIRAGADLMNELIKPDSEMNFGSISLKAGESGTIHGHSIRLAGFNRNPNHRMMDEENVDISIAARIIVDNQYEIEPIFLISKEGEPAHFNEFIPELGLHVRFVHINPQEEVFTFFAGQQTMDDNLKFPIEIAENAQRNDWIYLEARIFPGINLFWAGTLLMMFGFLWSLAFRLINQRKRVIS